MAYDLFLIDLDDTLLDFRASERLSFAQTLTALRIGVDDQGEARLYADYARENMALWRQFEEGTVTKEFLKAERWRRLFAQHSLDLDPEVASKQYLDTLPTTVVLIDHAAEICEYLSSRGEIGIVTNGIHTVQTQRIANSALAPYISFICVSDACGFAKPDIRFFEHSSRMAKRFNKANALVIGDRREADILGAQRFGVHSCWFNPHRDATPHEALPTYEIAHLSEIRPLVA